MIISSELLDFRAFPATSRSMGHPEPYEKRLAKSERTEQHFSAIGNPLHQDIRQVGVYRGYWGKAKKEFWY